MPVIALTGATGFVGQSIIRHLLAEQPRTRLKLLVRNSSSRILPDAFESSSVEIIPGDLCHADTLDALVRDCDSVVHVGAAIAGNCAADFDRVNVLGSRFLADAISRHAPGAHLIHISSLAARDPSLSWYASSKRCAEEVLQSRLEHLSILRPPAVYGPADPALAGFWRWLARGMLIRLGPSEARFSLLHVDDLVRAVLSLLEHLPAGEILNLAGPQPADGWRWDQIAATAARVRGGPVRIMAVPPILLGSMATIAPVLGRLRNRPVMLNRGKVRELRHHDWVCDNLAIRRLLDWQPLISLERALATLPGWSRS